MSRRYRPLRLLLVALLIASTLSAAAGAEGSASDPRFFGSYCGSHQESQTVRFPCVPIFPWILCSRTEHVNFEVSASVDHEELTPGAGVILGSGSARVTGDVPSFLDDHVRPGDEAVFVFTGRVVERGRAEGSALAPGWQPTTGRATLSGDGLELEVVGLDRVVSMRKDACGNTPPSAEIRLPEVDHVPWQEVVQLTAVAEDAEDESFPDERLVWSSSLDGALGSGRTLWRNDLSPGRHEIVFTATDSGGLTAVATKTLTVENRAPTARIDLPEASGDYSAGVRIAFRGRGWDAETGNLVGESLVWTYSGGFLGTGTEFSAELPQGRHRIRLSASDGELAGQGEVVIDVGPRPPGNAPPSVVITSPPDRSAPVGGRPADHDGPPDEFCVQLTAEAFDAEDGPLTGHALVWTDRMDGAAESRTLPATGASIEACGFATSGGDTWHTVTVVATDSEGATAEDSIRILVIGGGLI